MMDYRLVHFNCARPIGTFDLSNEFVPVFFALLPRSRSGVRRTTSGRSAIPAVLTRLACDASPMKPTAATDLAS
jgi:hypothetical protein